MVCASYFNFLFSLGKAQGKQKIKVQFTRRGAPGSPTTLQKNLKKKLNPMHTTCVLLTLGSSCTLSMLQDIYVIYLLIRNVCIHIF